MRMADGTCCPGAGMVLWMITMAMMRILMMVMTAMGMVMSWWYSKFRQLNRKTSRQIGKFHFEMLGKSWHLGDQTPSWLPWLLAAHLSDGQSPMSFVQPWRCRGHPPQKSRGPAAKSSQQSILSRCYVSFYLANTVVFLRWFEVWKEIKVIEVMP